MMGGSTSPANRDRPSEPVIHSPRRGQTGGAGEAIIAKLAASPAARRFPLHGAWAVAACLGGLPRPTWGVDLIDRERGSVDDIISQLADVIGPRPGGFELYWSALRVQTKGARRFPLHRLTIPARRGSHGLTVRIDITAARDPAPTMVIRSLQAAVGSRLIPEVACLVPEEIVAEKVALLVTYGADHTRLHDIFDLWLLLRWVGLDHTVLVDTLVSAFAGRDAVRMLLRDDGYWQGAFNPARLTEADRHRWKALLAQATAPVLAPDLDTALLDLAGYLSPMLYAMRQDMGVPKNSAPNGAPCPHERGADGLSCAIPQNRNPARVVATSTPK